MPRKKTKKLSEIKAFEDNDESLIVHLPIKTEDSKMSNKELNKLRKENKELREKLSLALCQNNKKVIVYKNNPNQNKQGKCWWCDGDCNNHIILPDKKINNSFYGLGRFCSFNCAQAYNFELRDEKVWERCSLLYQLKDTVINNIDKINPSPPKQILKEFGGEISRDEYNELLMSIDYSYLKLLPPMISSTILIEQRSKHIDLIDYNLVDLKLKRSKPVSKSRFSLDNIVSL